MCVRVHAYVLEIVGKYVKVSQRIGDNHSLCITVVLCVINWFPVFFLEENKCVNKTWDLGMISYTWKNKG